MCVKVNCIHWFSFGKSQSFNISVSVIVSATYDDWNFSSITNLVYNIWNFNNRCFILWGYSNIKFTFAIGNVVWICSYFNICKRYWFSRSSIKYCSYFVLSKRNYLGNEKTFYSNLIFESIFGNTNHKYKAGASFLYDDFNEDYLTQNFKRTETVPGLFAEYTLI